MALLKCPDVGMCSTGSHLSEFRLSMSMPISSKPRIRIGKPTKLPNGLERSINCPGRSKPYRAMKQTNG